MLMLAKATGWAENELMRMPMKRAMQYLHAYVVHEGNATRWKHSDEAKEAAFESKLENILKREEEFLEDYE